MDFEQRLEKAVARGRDRGEKAVQAEAAAAISKEEMKRLHTKYRLQLSEHIEQCLRTLPTHFPGFQFETLYGDKGWGAACSRDDIRILKNGKRANEYSRLEMTIRPISSFFVVDLNAKGTVRNKEIFRRNHYEKAQQVDPGMFLELIDIWVLEYAEQFAASS